MPPNAVSFIEAHVVFGLSPNDESIDDSWLELVAARGDVPLASHNAADTITGKVLSFMFSCLGYLSRRA